jgi:hypothetical protein
MKTLRRLVLLLSLVLALPARATTLVALSTPELVDAASVVAIVRIQSVDVKRHGKRVVTHAVAKVEKSLKGSTDGASLKIAVPGGELNGWGQRVEGAPVVTAGERCLAFLEPAGASALQFVGLEQGHLVLAQHASGEVVIRTSEAVRIDPLTGRGAAPLPPVEPAAPLMRSIEERVRGGR